MKFLMAGLMLAALAGCGELHPVHNGGASAVPATSGGLTGPQEGSPGNAVNMGSGPTTILNDNK